MCINYLFISGLCQINFSHGGYVVLSLSSNVWSCDNVIPLCNKFNAHISPCYLVVSFVCSLNSAVFTFSLTNIFWGPILNLMATMLFKQENADNLDMSLTCLLSVWTFESRQDLIVCFLTGENLQVKHIHLAYHTDRFIMSKHIWCLVIMMCMHDQPIYI